MSPNIPVITQRHHFVHITRHDNTSCRFDKTRIYGILQVQMNIAGHVILIRSITVITVERQGKFYCLYLIFFVFLTSGCMKRNTVTVTIEPPGSGTILLEPNQDGYKPKDTVLISATPNADYRFSRWIGDRFSFENPLTILWERNTFLSVIFASLQCNPIEPEHISLTAVFVPIEKEEGEGEIFEGEGEGEPIEGESAEGEGEGEPIEGEGEPVEGEGEGESEGEGEPAEGEVVEEGEIESGLLVSVAAGTFKMGRPYTDTGEGDELPVHDVDLSAYQIGKYPVMNKEFADVLNWAYASGYLKNETDEPYSGGRVFAYGQVIADTFESSAYSQITYADGVFNVRIRKGLDNLNYSMANHPITQVTWYGAVAYCNWLSEINGLTPCYNTDDWSLIDPLPKGYRLPTEAEWERAAAWDASGDGKHWRFGVSSDELSSERANYRLPGSVYANPIQLQIIPYSSPVGWYNGENPVNLATPDTPTIDSATPAGAYDMAGNVYEWCQDWYQSNYYTVYENNPVPNPTGPVTGTARVLRGGAWNSEHWMCRAAYRDSDNPTAYNSDTGFRVCISN